MRLHSYDWVALSFGALFLAIVGNWWAHEQGLVSIGQLALAAPITLIVLGLLGIVGSLTSASRTRSATPGAGTRTAPPSEETPTAAERTSQ